MNLIRNKTRNIARVIWRILMGNGTISSQKMVEKKTEKTEKFGFFEPKNRPLE